MANSNQTQAIEKLAADIGDLVYIDVAKWHLYLSDAHLHTVVAERVYPLLENKTLSEEAVLQILQQIPVKLGAGKLEVPLADLLPMQCQVNLMDLLEKYES